MENKLSTDFKYPDEQIALQLQRYPDHTISYGSEDELQRMSFAELEMQAQRLALILKNHLHLEKGDVVAVLLPRTADFVVSLYAIWKAGLIFLPLPNETGKEYTEYRIRNCNAKCVIINNKTRHHDIENVPYFSLESIPTIRLQAAKAIVLDRNPLEDTYIYCSSGTTSDPKVIALPYIGIADRIHGIAKEMQIDANEDVLLCSCSFGFDASLSEILLALLTGASLTILPQYVRENILQRLPPYLQKIPNPKPTTTILIPSILRFIKSTKEFVGLKKILTTGEKCDIRWLRNLREWQFWNGYGPTETTFGATTTPIDLNADMISLHKETMGVKLEYRDNPKYSNRYGNRQCEVFVVGTGIGYYKNPPEDDKSFTSLSNDGIKRYETGDLVLVKDNNYVEFTRRIDSRRKIFAEQINLEVIAKKIGKCAGVGDVELEVEDNTLIAYVQASTTQEFNPHSYQARIDKIAKLGKRHRPSFSFLCESVINPAPPYHHITTVINQNHSELLKKYIDKIESIWKKLLLGNLQDDLLSVVKLDPNATFGELGGSSIAAYPMANEVLALLTEEAQRITDQREFFALATNAACTIGKLANFIMVANGIYQRIHLINADELSLVVINDSSTPLHSKFISKIHPLTIIEIVIQTEILEEAARVKNQELKDNIKGKLQYILNQISNSDHKTVIVNSESLCAKSDCIEIKHQNLPLKKFKKKAKKKLLSLTKIHIETNIQYKLSLCKTQFIARHKQDQLMTSANLNYLAKFCQVIGPPGSGKTASLVATLEQSSANMIPIDMQGCSTLQQAMSRIGFTPAELSLLKNTAVTFLIDNYDLKIFRNEAQYEPILQEWQQAKFIFYTRQEYQQLHRENTPEITYNRDDFQYHFIQSNDKTIFGFQDTPLFRNWLGTAIPSPALLLKVLTKWFEYDYHRRHNINPSNNDLIQFLTTLHILERDYIQQGIALCFDPSLSIWHGDKHSVHALGSLKYIEHIKPLLICVNTEKLLYQIPNEWLNILNTRALLTSRSQPDPQKHSIQSINSLNMITELPKNFWNDIPAAFANSVENLSRVTGAANIFMIYPLTGDIPKQYFELKYYLENYNCYALRMPDSSFSEVADGRSVNLINRAKYCVSIIQHIQPHGPYALLGWSFGALLAYLIAKQLIHNNEMVTTIINIDGAPPVPLPESSRLKRVQHVISDLAYTRYQICCAKEVQAAIYDRQVITYHQAFEKAQAVLADFQDNATIKAFIAELHNVKINIDGMYHLAQQKIDYPQLPTIMQWLVATKMLPYINENITLKDWNRYITSIQIEQCDYDHFSILNPEAFKVINSFIKSILPSLSLDKVSFAKPIEFAAERKKQHLVVASQQFKLETIHFDGNRPIVRAEIFEDANSTRFEEFYNALRFNSLELTDQANDKNISEKPLFSKLKAILNETQATVSVINGLSGSGKTMLVEQLEFDLLNSFLIKSSDWLPIKINTDLFKNSNLTTLSQQLRLNLKGLLVENHVKLIFIIDDYDQESVNCINSIILSNPTRAIKFIVTSTNTNLANEFNTKISIVRYNILKPNLSSIISYCEQLDKYQISIGEETNYKQHLLEITRKYPNIFQLMSTPRNIRILLPYFRSINENGLTGELGLFKLSQRLFLSNIKSQIKHKNLHLRPGLNLELASTHYATELAFAIASGELNVANFNHDDLDTQTLKKLCRIKFNFRTEFEDSLFYYLQLANYILQRLDKRIKDNNHLKLIPALANIPLGSLTLTLDYIADYIHENRSSSQLILGNLILLAFNRSTNPTHETIAAASNALSVLSRTFHNLGNLNFRRCHFDRTNLDGAYLDHSWLDDASLDNIELSRTSLRHCSLNRVATKNTVIKCQNIDLPRSPTLFRFNHADTLIVYLFQYQNYSELKAWNIECLTEGFSYKINEVGFFNKIDFVFSKNDKFCIIANEKNTILLSFLDNKSFTMNTVPVIENSAEKDNELLAIKVLILNSTHFYIMKLYDNNSIIFEKWQYHPNFIKLGTREYHNEKVSKLATDDELTVSTINTMHKFGYIITNGLNSLVISQEVSSPFCLFKIRLDTQNDNDEHMNLSDDRWNYELYHLQFMHAFAWYENGVKVAAVKDNQVSIFTMDRSQSRIYCQQVPFDLGFFALRFNQSATKLLGATHEAIVVWDSQTGNLLHYLPTFHNEVSNFILSNNEKLLASSVLECAGNIIIRPLPEGSQPYSQAKFMSLGFLGKYSLWQIANQHFQLRVNGCEKSLPISLQQVSAVVTSIHHQNIAYSRFNVLIIQCYNQAKPLSKSIATNHEPLCYFNDRYLGLGKPLINSQTRALLCAVYDDKLDKLIELPKHLQSRIDYYDLENRIFIKSDDQGDWLVHFDRKTNTTNAILICLSDIENSCVLAHEKLSYFRFTADCKTLAAGDHISNFIVYHQYSSQKWNSRVTAFEFTHDNKYLIMTEDTANQFYLSIYDTNNSPFTLNIKRLYPAMEYAYRIVLSQDDAIIAILCNNGRISLYAKSSLQQLDEIVITYLHHNNCNQMHAVFTPDHDLIVTHPDNNQWYWRCSKDSMNWQWHLFWSAKATTTPAATHATSASHSEDKILQKQFGFFGVTANTNQINSLPKQDAQLLIILQRFYDVGIHGKIKSIQIMPGASVLSILVDNVYEDQMIYVPISVVQAMISKFETKSYLQSDPTNQPPVCAASQNWLNLAADLKFKFG